MKQALIASTSTVYGSGFLEYLYPSLEELFSNTHKILFLPYARPNGLSHSEYTKKAQNSFAKIGKEVIGIHQFKNPKEAVKNAEAIFVGGGNTFVLINTLHEYQLIDVISTAISSGVPYLGTSAGSNICGQNIKTTNDMPIVYPHSFEGLKILPFNINPHYMDPIKGSTHMGETRETRITEFHKFNDFDVLGLREGSFLILQDQKILLQGPYSARLFRKNKRAIEIPSKSDLEQRYKNFSASI